jgi:hypothetical protein
MLIDGSLPCDVSVFGEWNKVIGLVSLDIKVGSLVEVINILCEKREIGGRRLGKCERIFDESAL